MNDKLRELLLLNPKRLNVKLNSLNVTPENVEQNTAAREANKAFYEKHGLKYMEIENTNLFNL